ncbi:MAG: DNA translocase FtsK 4TM domain-containing protein, partial [Candidatus Falkowbacteria bacterium]|nr:DNA translocase FtsK 4TM domain-containing protein [Candidatus Falkowbacteria bacterium]
MFNKKRKYKKKNEVVPIELDENGEEIHSGIKKGILIVLIVTLGFVSLLSLFGAAGALGIYIQKFLTMMLGWGRWSFPSIMLFLGYFFYSESKYHIKGITYVGIFLFFISVHALMHLFVPVKDWSTAINLGIGGGYTGYLVALAFYKTVDLLASWIILLAIFISSLMLIFNAPLQRIIGRESPLAILFAPFKFLHNKLFAKIDTEGNEDEDSQETEDASDDDEKEEEIAKKYDNESLDEIFSVKTISEDGKPKRKATLIEEQLKKVPDVDLSLNSSIQKIDLPINLLKAAASKPTSGDIKANVEIITNTLENFGIPIEMGDITVGPTVTQYAFKPADGVKLSRITTLRSDLSLALAAHPIR